MKETNLTNEQKQMEVALLRLEICEGTESLTELGYEFLDELSEYNKGWVDKDEYKFYTPIPINKLKDVLEYVEEWQRYFDNHEYIILCLPKSKMMWDVYSYNNELTMTTIFPDEKFLQEFVTDFWSTCPKDYVFTQADEAVANEMQGEVQNNNSAE